MADIRSEDLLYRISPADAVHLAFLLLLAGCALFFCPNLEDLSAFALFLLASYCAAFALFILGGAAWAFDANDAQEAESKYQAAAVWAAVILILVYLLYLFQGSDVGGRPGVLLSLAGAWGSICAARGWPYERVKRWERERPHPAGSYALEAETPKPAPSAPLPPGIEEMLVGSGTFKIDPRRMVEKLSQHQLQDPKDFLLPWLRLAVASGASRIDLSSGSGIEMRFDGEFLSPKALSDPYACFLEEDEGAARHRHLAYGLLALFRLAPRSIEVFSGGGRLLLEPEGKSSHEPEEPSGPGTVIRVRWGVLAPPLLASECVAKAREAFGLCDAKLFVGGEEAPPPWTAFRAEPRSFEDGRTRGVLIPALESEHRSRVRFYVQGACAGWSTARDCPRRYKAFVTDPSLVLSLSQDGVVQDDASRAVKERVEKHALKLIKENEEPARVAERFAYTRSGLFAALGGAGAAFGLFILAVELRPDLVFAAGAAYAVVTLAMLAFCARWFLNRLRGLRNPFKKK